MSNRRVIYRLASGVFSSDVISFSCCCDNAEGRQLLRDNNRVPNCTALQPVDAGLVHSGSKINLLVEMKLGDQHGGEMHQL